VFGIEYFDFTVEGREVDRKTFYKEKTKISMLLLKLMVNTDTKSKIQLI
jgi:hypothetical protein